MSNKKETERRLVDIDSFMDYVGLGKSNARKLGKSIGCLVILGHKHLYDLRKTDQYLDSLSEVR